MNELMLALMIAVLFGTGTYLLFQRTPIRLVLGLALLSHGVNLLLLSSGGFQRGLPPIIADKSAFTGDISPYVDPLPQALILTAIVISFGVTAFMLLLINRRNALVDNHTAAVNAPDDPFAPEAPLTTTDTEEDYEYLEQTIPTRKSA